MKKHAPRARKPQKKRSKGRSPRQDMQSALRDMIEGSDALGVSRKRMEEIVVRLIEEGAGTDPDYDVEAALVRELGVRV